MPASELETSAGGRAKPGLSRNKLCIAAATDGEGRAVIVPCGRGKPSGARALAAYGPHVGRGSTLVHDKENAHNALVRKLGLVGEAHDSRLLRGLPDRENPLRDVNRLHFLVKEFLGRHRGFDRGGPGWVAEPLQRGRQPAGRRDGQSGARARPDDALAKNAQVQGVLWG